MLPMCSRCGNPPDLQGILERLQELTTPYHDLTEVRMTFAPHGRRSRVTLHTVVRGKGVQLTRVRHTLDEAIDAVLERLAQVLRQMRRRARGAST
jgi:ribosome-associated translation inhibitor RaiA